MRKVPYEISRQMGKPGREKRKGDREEAGPGRRSSVGKVIETTEAAGHVDSTVSMVGRQGVLRLQRMTGISSSSVRSSEPLLLLAVSGKLEGSKAGRGIIRLHFLKTHSGGSN